MQDNIQVRRGWKTWQKYQHLFPSKTFILKGCSYGNGVVEIVLVHRNRFVQVVNEHIENFKAVLGEAINGELLLKQYEVGDRPLFILLKENHGLLGILLGFGKNNSMKFAEWIATVHGERKSSAMLHQSQKEFHLQSVFEEVNHQKPYKYLYLPAFLAESSSSETRALGSNTASSEKGFTTSIAMEICLKLLYRLTAIS